MICKNLSFWAVEKKIICYDDSHYIWVVVAMFASRQAAETYANNSTLETRISEKKIDIKEDYKNE